MRGGVSISKPALDTKVTLLEQSSRAHVQFRSLSLARKEFLSHASQNVRPSPKANKDTAIVRQALNDALTERSAFEDQE